MFVSVTNTQTNNHQSFYFEENFKSVFHFYIPWKNQKIWFSDIFSGYSYGTFAWNGSSCFLAKIFLPWFFSTSAKPRTSTENIILKKQELPPPPDPSKIDYYKNFDELWKRVTKLSLPSYWKINCSNTVHLYKSDPIYENPVLDIFVSDTFNFIIRVFAWCLPTDHEIYKNYNSSFKNITVSN